MVGQSTDRHGEHGRIAWSVHGISFGPMMLASYRDLKVWQLGVELALQTCRATGRFPVHERYGLASQLRRAAVSVPSNIAEGHARSGTREYLRFVAVARGSLAEVDTQLVLAERLGYLDSPDAETLRETIDILGKMLRRLTQALERRCQCNAP